MASSSANISSFNFINIVQLVFVKLDGTNYLNWLSQFVPILKSNYLMDIVDGYEPCL